MRAITIAVVLALCVVAMCAAQKGTNQDQWMNTDMTTQLWQLISAGHTDELKKLLEADPSAASARAADGRGALWWAYEYNRPEMIKMLVAAGAQESERDADGKKPSEVTVVGETEYAREQRLKHEARMAQEAKRYNYDDDAGSIDDDDDDDDEDYSGNTGA